MKDYHEIANKKFKSHEAAIEYADNSGWSFFKKGGLVRKFYEYKGIEVGIEYGFENKHVFHQSALRIFSDGYTKLYVHNSCPIEITTAFPTMVFPSKKWYFKCLDKYRKAADKIDFHDRHQLVWSGYTEYQVIRITKNGSIHYNSYSPGEDNMVDEVLATFNDPEKAAAWYAQERDELLKHD